MLVVPHGKAYHLADSPGTEATYGPEDAVAFFRGMAAGELPSIVGEGHSAADGTQFICGFFGCDLRRCNPVLDALPATAGRARGCARRLDELQTLPGKRGSLGDGFVRLMRAPIHSGRTAPRFSNQELIA